MPNGKYHYMDTNPQKMGKTENPDIKKLCKHLTYRALLQLAELPIVIEIIFRSTFPR